jgi:hypothetical protein
MKNWRRELIYDDSGKGEDEQERSTPGSADASEPK